MSPLVKRRIIGILIAGAVKWSLVYVLVLILDTWCGFSTPAARTTGIIIGSVVGLWILIKLWRVRSTDTVSSLRDSPIEQPTESSVPKAMRHSVAPRHPTVAIVPEQPGHVATTPPTGISPSGISPSGISPTGYSSMDGTLTKQRA